MSSQKSKRNEETENFIHKWQKEEGLWDVCSPTYKDRNMRHESIKRLMPKFPLTGN